MAGHSDMRDATKRLFDIVLACAVGVVALPFGLLIAVAVKLTSGGPAVYWSNRVGCHGAEFRMPKFRTMLVGTPAVATHLLADARATLTPIGGFLRETSLDEIPQLFSVLRGDMSFVGPRPALFNQDDLIALRKEAGVDDLRPGITGWAQINGRDELPIPVKVAFDREYRDRRSLAFDVLILVRTAGKMLGDKTVTH